MQTKPTRLLTSGILVLASAMIALIGLSCLGSNPAVQAVAPREPAALGWGEPLVIRWNQSVHGVVLQVTPSIEARSVIDEGGQATYVYLDPGEDARAYQVTVTDAVGTNGTHLLQPATFQVAVARRPHPVGGSEPLQLNDDDEIRLQFDQPMKDIVYQVGQVEGPWQLDERDPSVVWLKPGGLRHNDAVPIVITNAVSLEGAPLAAPVTMLVQTAPALDVEFDPHISMGWVPPDSHLTFSFSEPIRGGSRPEGWITFDPAIPGRFEWLDARNLEFIPDVLPEDNLVRVVVRGRLEGPRSQAGGYLDQETTAFRFVTAPDKTIEVSLRRQLMTLYEGDREVKTLPVATGVRGADTPVGEFRVQYKMPKTRFVGINTVSRTRYDIPDVHWVMAFMGDYTIHGAYWRSVFGAPGSNGCVSLSDANAKIVYDWAPEGTFINIHD